MSYGRGRFQHGCYGECSSAGDRRGSRLEGEIYQLLSFVLGGGQRDVPFPGDGRIWVDMVFELAPGYRLAIEYDGAHWHEGKEDSDWRKSERLVGSGFATEVLRIREDPLECLSESDVLVPSGSDAHLISRLALLHLIGGVLPVDHWSVADAVGMFLRSSAQQLHAWQIACRSCRSDALSWGIADQQAPPEGRKHPFPSRRRRGVPLR